MACSLPDVEIFLLDPSFQNVVMFSDPSLLNLRYALWSTILIGFAHSSIPFETCGYSNLDIPEVKIWGLSLILWFRTLQARTPFDNFQLLLDVG